MEAATELPGLGRAATCVASASHSPEPLRYVWHHVQPKEAGGATIPENLASVCDSCHYTIHRLMWNLAQGLSIGTVPRKTQLALAQQGYNKCLAAGTVAKIPNEG